MANLLYPTFKSKLLGGDIDMDSDTIKLVMLDNTYAYSASHEFLDDITGTLGTAVTMTGATIMAGGVFDADDLSYAGVDLGETVRSIILYKDTGSAASSPLIAFFDTEDDGSPINRVGTGAPIPLLWPSIAARIIKL